MNVENYKWKKIEDDAVVVMNNEPVIVEGWQRETNFGSNRKTPLKHRCTRGNDEEVERQQSPNQDCFHSEKARRYTLYLDGCNPPFACE